MPEPENGAAEDLNPEVPNTTPDDSAPVVEDNSAELAVAKIAELTLALGVKDQRIAELTAEVQAAKAANYDLLMATPGQDDTTPGVTDSASDTDPEIDPDDVTIDDILYEKE